MNILPDLTRMYIDGARHIERTRLATCAIAKALSRDTYVTDDPERSMRARGFGDHVPGLRIKAAVDPLMVTDNENLAGFGEPELAFIGAVDHAAVLGPLVAGGAPTWPISPAGSGRVFLGTISGSTVAENQPKPISSVDFDLTVAPVKAVATLVTTAETARAVDRKTQDGLTAALVAAVASRVNAHLAAQWTSGTPAASADPAVLLAALSSGSPRRPAIVADYLSLLSLGAGQLRDLIALGVRIIPAGEFAGVVVALDLSGLLVSDSGGVVEIARHASLAMTDDGAGAPGFSLFQRNCIGLRGERWFAVNARPDAIAFAHLGSPA